MASTGFLMTWLMLLSFITRQRMHTKCKLWLWNAVNFNYILRFVTALAQAVQENCDRLFLFCHLLPVCWHCLQFKLESFYVLPLIWYDGLLITGLGYFIKCRDFSDVFSVRITFYKTFILSTNCIEQVSIWIWTKEAKKTVNILVQYIIRF